MTIWYGGDYNPEQWPEEIWPEDVRLMREAGVTMVTLGVFAWSRIEGRPGVYDFDWLDRIIGLLHEAGIGVDLATATASPPPWLVARHPEVLPVDERGTRLAFGSRQSYCPSSPIYREHAAGLVEALASRYGQHPAVRLWHVNNEYGCHVARCYCDVSAAAFRGWLRTKYGTVEALNLAWGTAFWSQLYGDFDEVEPPRAAPYHRNPTHQLDFDRFSDAELLGCFQIEAAILRRVAPQTPVTTNFMGFLKDVDYWAWRDAVDIVSDDSYPDPADPGSPAHAAMTRDLMRSLAGGKPWMIMEQATSAVNWRPVNVPKASGQMAAWSFQALARGASGLMFFQWRQSLVGAERFHSAMIPHAGTGTRVWGEVAALGRRLADLDPSDFDIERPAVAVVLSWDAWRALEQEGLPAHLSYLDEVRTWHEALSGLGMLAEFVPPGADLGPYRIVVAPTLFAADDVALTALAEFCERGGHLIVTYQSAIVDENAHVRPGGYLGALAPTLGLRIEEFAPARDIRLLQTAPGVPPLTARHGWGELIVLTGASPIATFAAGDLAGRPAVTRHRRADGEAWYVATGLDVASARGVIAEVAAAAGLPVHPIPPGIEHVVGRRTITTLNHTAETRVFVDEQGRRAELRPFEVKIVGRGTGASSSSPPER